MGTPLLRRFGDGTAAAATAVLATLAAAVLVLLSSPAWAQADHMPRGVAGIQVNGRPLDAQGQRALRQIEARTGPVPPGRYWYDAMTDAAGAWGGPVAVVLAPGLLRGGPLPAAASGGSHRG